MVFHRLNGQVNTNHLTDLTGPQTSTINNMLCVDRTFRRHNIPAAIGALRHGSRATMGEILRTMRFGRLGKRISRAGRVQMAVLRIPQHCMIVVWIDQRVTIGQFLGRNEFLVQPHVARF